MTETLDPTPDPLVTDLQSRLPGMIQAVLGEPEVETVLGQVRPEAVRQQVLREVEANVLLEADDLLRATNPEISDLREAQTTLVAQESRHAEPTDEMDRWAANRLRWLAGYAVFGFGLWSSVIYPVAVWQLWSPLSTAVGGFWAVLAFTVGGVGLLLLVNFCVGQAGVLLVGRRLEGGAGWAVALGLPAAFLLLLWQLWAPSMAVMGGLWAWTMWIVAGLLVGFGALVGAIIPSVVSSEPRGDEEKKVEQQALLILLLSICTGLGAWLILRDSTMPEWQSVLVAAAVGLAASVAGTPFVAFLARNPLLNQRFSVQLSFMSGRPGGGEWRRDRDRERLVGLVDQADQVWREAADRAVRPTVLRHVNGVVQPGFATVLGKLDRSGLGQMRAGERAVATQAFAQLRGLTEDITSGAVGMAGPRGAGKSTLLEAYQAGKFLAPGHEHIAVLESVPVRYDARDFTLYLYARTCAEVIKFCNRQLPDVPRRWSSLLARIWRLATVPLIVAAWLVAGFVGQAVVGGQPVDLLQWLRSLWWPLVVVMAAVTAMIVTRHRPVTASELIGPELARQDLDALRTYAQQRVDGITFQQKHTSGWSGKVSLLFGAEGSLSGSRELTRQPMSYPQVVHEFGQFLSTTITCVTSLPNVASPAVVIILDELDKIFAAEQAQEFVNEVKALFNLDVPGFLFLVSVSEDALASFERRGLPVRDVFDSAFDAIFRVEYLKLDDARAVLGSRILGMPEPFVCLCHCMAGGLPRELIRVARQVTGREGPLAEVCREIVAADLRAKVAALRTVIARRAHDDVPASELMRHVDAHAVADAPTLFNAVATPPIERPASGVVPDQLVDLLRLQLESLGYLYYCATLLELFDDSFAEQDMAKGKDSQGDAAFDTLTSVRQLFSLNARLAWLTVSAFRAAWGWDTVEPPS